MNIRKIQSKAYLSILLLLLPLLANAQVKIDSIWYNLDTESMTAEVIKKSFRVRILPQFSNHTFYGYS